MAKKKILIFAHYYHPDVASTGQILKDQAEGMLDEFDVTVICVVPSYIGTIEDKYKTQKYHFEEINGVKIIRVRVPEFTKGSKVSRIKNILAYFFGALGAARKAGKQDYVFTISQPPILGGLLGVLGKWLKHAKMIYCIQDYNPEQTMAVGYFNNKFVLSCMMAADKFSCYHSDLVITVGRDLVQTLVYRFKGKNVPNHVMINNWINEKEIYPLTAEHEQVLAFRKKYSLEDKFVIMYSGNIGLYYDLENLMKVIEKFKPGTRTTDNREVVFAFVGAGSVLDKLVHYVREHHMDNVIFIPYQDKEDLIYSLNAADVHWCVNAKGIKGVSCPSKYYGIAAAAKPVLGVLESGSEVRMLIEETNGGLVSEPGDYVAVEENIQRFLEDAGSGKVVQMGKSGHDYLVKNLTKDVSIKKYIEAIKNL
ncbi:glycosyltransferase family 4 protein [Neobacillus drentensis]|uniref:glycosyltransferase family 4 protein n=1 Tax=Neobacillus drentensis TaxID=220684 RepID=UPI002FFDCD24